jgi:hypothetical protein
MSNQRSSSLVPGFAAVRIHPKLVCPDCGRFVQPHDAVRVDDSRTEIVCAGCHAILAELEHAGRV